MQSTIPITIQVDVARMTYNDLDLSNGKENAAFRAIGPTIKDSTKKAITNVKANCDKIPEKGNVVNKPFKYML